MVLILKIKKRYYLKKKKVKEIKKDLGEYGSFIGNKDTLELLESEDYDFILVNGEPYIIMIAAAILAGTLFTTAAATGAFNNIFGNNVVINLRNTLKHKNIATFFNFLNIF